MILSRTILFTLGPVRLSIPATRCVDPPHSTPLLLPQFRVRTRVLPRVRLPFSASDTSSSLIYLIVTFSLSLSPLTLFFRVCVSVGQTCVIIVNRVQIDIGGVISAFDHQKRLYYTILSYTRLGVFIRRRWPANGDGGRPPD